MAEFEDDYEIEDFEYDDDEMSGGDYNFNYDDDDYSFEDDDDEEFYE